MLVNIILFVINKCIAPLIEGYIILKICNALLKKKFKNRFIDLFIVLEIALAIEIIASFDVSKNIPQQILILLFLLLIIFINYEGKYLKKIISYIMYILIIIIGETITAILLITITGKNLSVFFLSEYYYAWAVIISKSIQLIILRILVDKLFNKEMNIKNSYKLRGIMAGFCIIMICFSSIEIIHKSAYDDKYIATSTAVILYLVMIIAISLMSIVFYRIIKQTRKQAEQQQLLEQYKLEHKYSKELNKILDNLRILKHDLKNHISCMWGLVETNNLEDFKLYLSKLTDELDGYDEDTVAIDIVKNKE